MDKVFDFFKDLKERISSPLISSFVISWLIINWEIITALLKFETSILSLPSYLEYISYIKSLIVCKNIFWHPFYAALFYTIIYPFIRNFFQTADAWFKGWGNNWKLSISKANKISIQKYIQLREVYQKRSDTLEAILEKESEFLKKNEEYINLNNELKIQNIKLEGEIIALKEYKLNTENEMLLLNASLESYKIQLSKFTEKVADLSNKKKVEILNGIWEKTEYNTEIKKVFSPTIRLRFLNGVVFEIDKNGIETPNFNITAYDYNEVNKNITITTNISIDGMLLYYYLKPNDDFNQLIGKSNLRPAIKIEFKKISD